MDMAARLTPLRILKPTAVSKHTGTVIFFHGSGSTGEGCADFDVGLTMRAKFEFPHLKVIFPTAPLQPYTPLGGELSNVWFDRRAISPLVPENLESIQSIGKTVKALIAEENAQGISNNRIVVGGISMGGALALYTGFLWENSLAGIFALSSFLNENSCVYEHLRKEKPSAPKLLQFHGLQDDLIPYAAGKATFDRLKALGVDGELRFDNNGEHMPNKSQLLQVHSWIRQILPNK